MYEEIAKIVEFRARHSGENHIKQINAYLKLGWVILAIQQRGYDHTRIGEEAETVTVYTLGHEDVNGEIPTPPPPVRYE